MYELLIVDDETSSRDVIASCFPWEEEGFHVCGLCDTGAHGLTYVKEHPVHVVLTDITMPEMDGITLAKELHEYSDDIVVIFLSAHDDFTFAKDGMKYGVRYYLVKPATFAELKEVFETVRAELDKKYHVESDLADDTEDDLIQALRQYCNTHYSDGTLSDFAGEQFLTPSYVSQLIRQKSDRNFSDFLTQARMEQARILLSDPAQKIYRISELVGYINPNNFARAFKTYFGMTPSEYKEHEK
ncbi:MAG: response regulator [Lachnospiraceae bacterium]|nr:response regulator [Lachnospiraceae bacterium]